MIRSPRPSLPSIAALVLALALGACTQFPDLDDSVGDALADADYPALATADQLAGLSAADPGQGPREAQALQARAAALQARADALRGDIVDAETRRRLDEGVATD